MAKPTDRKLTDRDRSDYVALDPRVVREVVAVRRRLEDAMKRLSFIEIELDVLVAAEKRQT